MTLNDRRRALMAAKRGFVPILPSEYQEVDYIYTGGNIVLTTTLKLPKTALTIKGAFSFDGELTREQYFFADRDSGGVRLCIAGRTTTTPEARVYVFGGFTTWYGSATVLTENVAQFVATVSGSGAGSSVTLNGNINGDMFSATNSGNARVYGNNNIKFFDANGSVQLKGKMIGRFTVENPNGLVYRFVPCYRIADLVPGIFETETSSFVGNSSLIKGNDIN